LKPAPRTPRPARPRAAGFSLIEVLVAMAVVAVGVLALAGLLQAATRHAKASQLDATATLLAVDIADRLRANAAGARLGQAGYDLGVDGFGNPPAPARVACTRAAPCSAAGLAQADLADWTARVRATLPRGSAWLRFRAGVPPASDAVGVWVGWADPRAGPAGGAGDHSGGTCPATWQSTDVALRCIYLQVAL